MLRRHRQSGRPDSGNQSHTSTWCESLSAGYRCLCMNIMVVDDDSNSREILSELLNTDGFTVTCLKNSRCALDVLKTTVPDMIISDTLMPGMDGFEFCQRIRSDGRLANIPFVLLSDSLPDRKDSEFARSIGVSRLLRKPVDRAEFISVVKDILTGSKRKTAVVTSISRNNVVAAKHVKLESVKPNRKVLELDAEKASSRERENQLRLISDSLPELVSETDVNNHYVFVNEMYASAYDSDQQSLVGKTVREIVGEVAYKIIRPELELALGGRETSSILNLPLGDRNQASCFLARFVPRLDIKGKVISVVSVFSEITHLHQVDTALHERESMLTSVLSVAPIILLAVDVEGTIQVSEGKSLDAIGYIPGENVGQSIFDAFRNAPSILQDLMFALKGQKFITTVSLADCILKVTYTPQFNSEGNFIGTIGVAVDQTMQHSLEREVMRVSDAERERISKDLHDALGQTLSGINLLSRALYKKLSDQDLPEADDARKLGELAAYATRVSREAIQGLSPVSRTESGLMLALEELTATTGEIHKVPCSFQYDPEIRLSDHQTETQVYRILQEAINNAVKHANPLQIDVACHRTGDMYRFSVQDKTRKRRPGKPEKDIWNSMGLGLNIMRYRSNMIGASLSIETDETGTRVTCSVPR